MPDLSVEACASSVFRTTSTASSQSDCMAMNVVCSVASAARGGGWYHNVLSEGFDDGSSSIQ